MAHFRVIMEIPPLLCICSEALHRPRLQRLGIPPLGLPSLGLKWPGMHCKELETLRAAKSPSAKCRQLQ